MGPYRLVRLLGSGGMGEVWLGEHAVLGRRAAVKVLHGQWASQPDIVARFFNEARAATAISDPGVVQVYDFGQHDDGSVFIVMELLEGEPLAQRLERRGSLGLGEALRLVRQVAASLAAAHALGIVHRDIKPDNIFIVRDGEVAGGERTKLLDFGIAKLAVPDAGLRTQTSVLMGTPTYMSPEQCRGAGQVDERTDIYSLGCVLYQLLVGRPPFDGTASGELIAAHLREPAPVPSALVPGLPAAVDALVARCLAKEPAARPATGAELAAAIDELLARAEVASLSLVGVPRMHASAVTPTTLSSTASQQLTVPPRPRRPLLALGGIAVVAAAIIVAFVALRRTPEPVVAIPPPPPPAIDAAVVVVAATDAPPPPPELGAIHVEAHAVDRTRPIVDPPPRVEEGASPRQFKPPPPPPPCNPQDWECP